ncbi:peptidase S15 [Marinobacter sp. R17]|uniref:CocE/NonD family hydrolase n=1 Tax=Marinobacter sp. R17 TaxID=2484250 RepID=UPI000F4D2380|nr:CocE/NonD family hydrolase [Marinobacter sp. R17]ROU01392.1 peptidase S15 [Marinobacter sp. R17]
MNKHVSGLTTASLLLLLLSGCGGGGSGDSDSDSAVLGDVEAADTSDNESPTTPAQPATDEQRALPEATVGLEAASCETGEHLQGDRSYRVDMPSRVDGAAIVFQVFEPRLFDCRNHHPLILQSHGFSGSRETEAGNDPLAPVQPLVDAGYTVISIDERGHGESGGTVRVMDPDYAGQDLVQIVDWAEANLDYLAYRDDNLLLGAVGGSYGGGFQYMLYNVDPDRRMDAMVPQITWHDLTDSLDPGGVVKTYWAAVLASLGDAGTGFSMDPFIRSTLLEGVATNRIPDTALDFFYYHSPDYFSDNGRDLALYDSGNTDDYLLDPLTGQLPITGDGHYVVKTPPRAPYPVDVLMFQGVRDNLFPLNEAYENYKTMAAAGGDVRLLTYPFGHHYLAPSVGLVQETLENGDFYAQALPEFPSEGTGPLSSCGDIDVTQATLAWFNEKLRGEGNADNVITSGHQVCFSLAPGDSVNAPSMTVGGEAFPIDNPLSAALPVTVLAGPNPLPTVIPLTSVDQDAVIAGIPTATLSLSFPVDGLDSACLDNGDPVLGLGTCDAIVFVGIGRIRNGVPELIDGQVQPVRGLGEHDIELTGIAERLQPGDKLALMVYGQYASTYLGAFSRDLTSYSLVLDGSVRLPLLASDGQSALTP